MRQQGPTWRKSMGENFQTTSWPVFVPFAINAFDALGRHALSNDFQNLIRFLLLARTNTSIKNHWNASMKRKDESFLANKQVWSILLNSLS
jgi:hypothetical protein